MLMPEALSCTECDRYFVTKHVSRTLVELSSNLDYNVETIVAKWPSTVSLVIDPSVVSGHCSSTSIPPTHFFEYEGCDQTVNSQQASTNTSTPQLML